MSAGNAKNWVVCWRDGGRALPKAYVIESHEIAMERLARVYIPRLVKQKDGTYKTIHPSISWAVVCRNTLQNRKSLGV